MDSLPIHVIQKIVLAARTEKIDAIRKDIDKYHFKSCHPTINAFPIFDGKSLVNGRLIVQEDSDGSRIWITFDIKSPCEHCRVFEFCIRPEKGGVDVYCVEDREHVFFAENRNRSGEWYVNNMFYIRTAVILMDTYVKNRVLWDAFVDDLVGNPMWDADSTGQLSWMERQLRNVFLGVLRPRLFVNKLLGQA